MKDDPRNHTNGHEQEATNEKMIEGKSELPEGRIIWRPSNLASVPSPLLRPIGFAGSDY